MFKNRHIELKLVKDSEEAQTEEIPAVSPEDVERIATNVIKKAAVATIITIAATVTLNTLSQIIINACDNHEEDED